MKTYLIQICSLGMVSIALLITSCGLPKLKSTKSKPPPHRTENMGFKAYRITINGAPGESYQDLENQLEKICQAIAKYNHYLGIGHQSLQWQSKVTRIHANSIPSAATLSPRRREFPREYYEEERIQLMSQKSNPRFSRLTQLILVAQVQFH